MAQQVAQGGAARLVGPVGEHLHRHPGLLADGLEEPGGEAGGGVLLVGRVLDHHAAVGVDLVGRIGLLGEVGVDGVAVVGGEEQATRQGLAAGLGGEAQRLPDAGEHVGEEGAHGPLAGAAAHLLVVEEAVELPEALRALRAEEPLQGGVGAAQIVNAGGLEEFTLRPDAHRRLPGAEHQVGGQDVPHVHPQLLRQQGGEGGAAAQGVEGLHVLLGVVVVAPVHVPLLVDGQAGDGEQIPVQIDQTPLHPCRGAHHRPARHGEGPVQPAGAVHAAVSLHRQADVALVPLQRVVFHIEGGRVAVGGGHAPALRGAAGQAEGDQAALVAGGVAALAGGERPGGALLQAGKARRLQPGGCSGRRVIGAGAVLNIFHQLVGCLHGKASFFHYYRAGGGKIKG